MQTKTDIDAQYRQVKRPSVQFPLVTLQKLSMC